MHGSNNMMPFDESARMHPKDERLVLLAYNVGRLEVRDEQYHAEKSKNQDLEVQLNCQKDEVARYRRYWENSASELERQVTRNGKLEKRLEKIKPKKKVVKK